MLRAKPPNQPPNTHPLPSPPSLAPNTSQPICSSLLSPQATFKGWMDIMYAAVDSREVRGQAGVSHNWHHPSLVPRGWFPLAGWEQSHGAEEELSTGWGWTPRPQCPLWLCPSVSGVCLHPTHGFS